MPLLYSYYCTNNIIERFNMTIRITNHHNGEVYDLTPAKGSARSAFKELYSYVRTIDRCDHRSDDTATVDMMVAIFRKLTVEVL